MKVILIGNAGTGKSTLARRLRATTGWPLLSLDRIWHAMDYSHVAKLKFAQAQRAFMAAHSDWLIDGNYGSTLPLRLAEADLVVWVQCPRLLAIARVLRRSWRFRRDPTTRPDMAPGFTERLDREYWAFLRYVWAYDRRAQTQIVPLLAGHRVVVVRTARQKRALLRKIHAGHAV
ncbi:topology modulation protein [Lacticaseibacillus absianus]|uniref:topology modulation protein n=1 Tax=Lacticaseibacillus absianus TaxID=2729623 RepID=UPI0015C7E056|nr:topology modulation protein [Lacticaseibacillus absianus]